MSLNGANELFRKLRAIDAVLENPEQVLGKAAETIRGGCVLECPVNDGALRNSIKTRVEGDKGYVYTNKAYAQYVEFGTGRKGLCKPFWNISICPSFLYYGAVVDS